LTSPPHLNLVKTQGAPLKFELEPVGRGALASRFFAQKRWISDGMR
jgi:hypothetical protein